MQSKFRFKVTLCYYLPSRYKAIFKIFKIMKSCTRIVKNVAKLCKKTPQVGLLNCLDENQKGKESDLKKPSEILDK